MASVFLGVLGLKAQQVRVQACVEAQNWTIVIGWFNVASGKDDHWSDFRVGLARWFCPHSRHTSRHELNGGFSLRPFESSERNAGTSVVEQATTVGRNVLIVAGLEAKEVAEFVVALAEPLG